MNLLAIDTSTEIASVALKVREEVLSEEQSELRQHAPLLLPMIQNLLSQAELQLNALDAIIYGQGPGSFTGLRIACSVAKGIAFAHDLPLYPVSGLSAIAKDAFAMETHFKGSVLSIIDARMQQLYWGCFTQGIDMTTEHVTDASAIELTTKDKLIVAGIGFEKYAPQLPEVIQSRIAKHYVLYPKAHTMIKIVENGQISKTTAQDALPVYLRNEVTQGGKKGG